MLRAPTERASGDGLTAQRVSDSWRLRNGGGPRAAPSGEARPSPPHWERWPVVAASLAVASAALLYISASLESQLGYAPDDTFYYLKLAQSFARSGQWSFDGGLTTTTGFHLLHAYFCTLVYRVMPGVSTHAVLSLLAGVQAALAMGALFLVDDVLGRVFRSPGRLALLVVGASGGFVTAPLMGMEWGWVVFFSALTIWATASRHAPLALMAALLATLARSDFPLVPLALFAGCLATPLRRDRALRTSTLSAAVGGALGLGIVTVHNLRVSGHLIQGSAQIKAHWGAVSGYHLLPPLDVAAKITSVGFLLLRTLDLGPLLFAVLVFAAIAVAAKVARSSDETPSELRSWLVMSAALIGAGYWAVYGANAAATQLWYSASFVIPAWIGSAALLERCRTKAGVRVATMGVAALALVGFIDARRPEWADRSLGPTAAAWVDRQVDGHRVGAWNAGVIGQFSKSQVINIDGLVNDEVQPYILTGVLQCYLFERNIDYVFDGDDMLTGPYPARGGYADGALRRALREKQRFISPDGAATRWMLYKVDRSALASSCSTARLSLLNPSAPFEPRHGQ